MKKPKHAPSTSRVIEDDSEIEAAPAPAKRSRTGNARASRSKTKEAETTLSGRGARAAKLQANKKLDAQAKELAEFQRQAALLTSPSKPAGRTTRFARGKQEAQPSPSKKPALGTRISARLRGCSNANESDDEWQQVPEEWLKENSEDSPPPTSRRTRSKGKTRAALVEEESEPADEVAQAGLRSDDAISELTELSDDPLDDTAEADDDPQATMLPELELPRSRKASEKVEQESKGEPIEEHLGDPHAHTPNSIPEDFMEWEAVSWNIADILDCRSPGIFCRYVSPWPSGRPSANVLLTPPTI